MMMDKEMEIQSEMCNVIKPQASADELLERKSENTFSRFGIYRKLFHSEGFYKNIGISHSA